MVMPKSQKRRVVRDFQAVIMAGGRGSRMMQLTSDFPKALLSVANKPLIWYSLNVLEKHGFKEVLIVVNKSSYQDIRKTLKDCLQMNIHINYFQLPDIDPDDFGTIDTLLLIKDKIEHNLLVMSCDIVCGDLPLPRVFDFHDLNDSSVTVLFSKTPNINDTPVPRPKFNRYIEKECTMFSCDHPQRLLFMSTESTQDKKLSLKKNSGVTFHTDLSDCHLYLIKKEVLQLLEREKFTSLRTDFLPWLIDATGNNAVKSSYFQDDNDPVDDMDLHFELAKAGKKIDLEKEREERKRPVDILEKINCYGYITEENLTCLRVDTLVTYCEANRLLAKQQAPKLDKSKLGIKVSQVCPETLVGASVGLAKGTSIKSSVIGCSCIIGENSSITNCIIMNKVTMGKRVTLNGCIISENATIPDNTEMRDCLVSKGETVTPGSHINEEFLGLNHMMTV